MICGCRWTSSLPPLSCSVISSLGSAAFASDMRASECKQHLRVDNTLKLNWTAAFSDVPLACLLAT